MSCFLYGAVSGRLRAVRGGGQSSSEQGQFSLESVSSLKDAYSDTVWNPFMREQEYDPAKVSMQENGLDYTNYFVQSIIATTHILADQLDVAREILDCLQGTFDRNGYFPRSAYQGLEYGWTSSMDAPTIAVAAQLFYEKTGEEAYGEFAKALCAYIPTDVSDHGFVAQVNGKPWLFEYASPNTTAKNGWFVLNGSLLGALGTAMMAAVTGDAGLTQLVEDQTALYKEMTQQFWYDNDAWCYYMLNRLTVNQPHYVIFEIRLLDALAEVVDDPFYAQESQRRRDMLLAQYPLSLSPDGNGGSQYLFIRRGAPHYYLTDIYATELTFFDGAGQLLDTVCTNLSALRSTPYLTGTLPEGTERVVWTSVCSKFRVEIGALQLQAYESEREDPPAPLALTWKASASGTLDGDTLLLTNSGEYDRCSLLGTLPEAVELLPTDIFVIELENLADEALSNNIVLYDAAGESADRYLIAVEPGKNLLVFSPLGFTGYGQKELTELLEWNLRIYTGAMTGEQASLRIGNAYQFRNQKQFYDFISASDYTLIAQDGN